MRMKVGIGLTKEQVRRIVLGKLKIVYRDWQSKDNPFSNRRRSGNRGHEARAFETALVAGLLGGLSEAIEKNNHLLLTALGRKDDNMRRKRQAKRRRR